VKFEEINLKFEKVQDKTKFVKVRDAHSITTIIGRHSVAWAYAYVILKKTTEIRICMLLQKLNQRTFKFNA